MREGTCLTLTFKGAFIASCRCLPSFYGFCLMIISIFGIMIKNCTNLVGRNVVGAAPCRTFFRAYRTRAAHERGLT